MSCPGEFSLSFWQNCFNDKLAQSSENKINKRNGTKMSVVKSQVLREKTLINSVKKKNYYKDRSKYKHRGGYS